MSKCTFLIPQYWQQSSIVSAWALHHAPPKQG
jgi:hypothetical protein